MQLAQLVRQTTMVVVSLNFLISKDKMNMNKLLSFIIIIWPFLVCSQSIIPVDSLGRPIPPDTSRWMSKDDIKSLKTSKVIYKKPRIYIEVSKLECFKKNPKLELMLTCLGNQLHSKDGEFITFIAVNRFLKKADSIRLQQSFPGMHIPDLNNQHVYQIRAAILYSLGKDASLRGENAAFNWKQYVHYYSDTKANKIFNADTAITFVTELNDSEVYKGKYKYSKALYLQKKGRGFIEIHSLYSNKGKKHLSKYWHAVEGIFKYED